MLDRRELGFVNGLGLSVLSPVGARRRRDAQPRPLRRRVEPAVLGLQTEAGRPPRAQLADSERGWQACRSPCALRHELLEVVRPRPTGGADGRPRLPVAVRRQVRPASAIRRPRHVPNIASKPKAAGERWTNGNFGPSVATTTGLMAWWVAPLPPRSRERSFRARTGKQRPSETGSVLQLFRERGDHDNENQYTRRRPRPTLHTMRPPSLSRSLHPPRTPW